MRNFVFFQLFLNFFPSFFSSFFFFFNSFVFIFSGFFPIKVLFGIFFFFNLWQGFIRLRIIKYLLPIFSMISIPIKGTVGITEINKNIYSQFTRILKMEKSHRFSFKKTLLDYFYLIVFFCTFWVECSKIEIHQRYTLCFFFNFFHLQIILM